MSLRPGAVDFNSKWSGLRETIRDVMQLRRVRMAIWNDHYSDIYALCEAFPASFADRLYKETQQLLKEFVSGLLEVECVESDRTHTHYTVSLQLTSVPLLLSYHKHTYTHTTQSLSSLTSVPLLTSYHKHWTNYQKGAKFLDNLFSYFNRVPLKKYRPSVDSVDYMLPMLSFNPPKLSATSENTPVEIRQMALSVWKNSLLEKLQTSLTRALLDEIGRERRVGETANLSMVRDIVSSLVEVEEYSKDSSLFYYQEVFETCFLQESGQYYRKEASKLTSELSCSEYIQQVVAKLREAKNQGERFLHPTSVTKFFRECEARLVEDFREVYLYPQVPAMIQEERREDLKNLFIMLRPLPRALDPLVREFENHVKTQGLAALCKLQLDKLLSVTDYITSVLSIYDKFFAMVTEVFGSHKLFISALDSACTAFVNTSDNPRQVPKASLLLARYCDQMLRKSSKGIGEQEVDEKLDKAIIVFRYIEDKDMFQRFYTRMLSRRLVQTLSVSMEAEESMIQKLKHACGYEYTSRLQRMVVDMKLSADGITKFNDHLKSKGTSLSVTFSCLVLQSAAWPLSHTSCPLALPDNLLLALKEFEQYYTDKHSGRKLSWLHRMSTGELKVVYLKRPYTVCVMTHQMVVLLAFNVLSQHSYSSLQRATQLETAELATTVQSLLACKLLTLDSDKEEEVGVASVIRVNESYYNKRTKFKVTVALQKESQQEVDQTQYNVQEDRKLHVQAAIVRVMKARKSLKHNQLIEETITQVKTRFTPNVQMIKRSIESLIDKQYLERSVDTKDEYMYVA